MSQSAACASCVGQSRAVTLKRNPITLDSDLLLTTALML
jgi:hypothetical protein